MVNKAGVDLKFITHTVKKLLQAGKYQISWHALNDPPERRIFATDILQALKNGDAINIEPKMVGKRVNYKGSDRYRWLGEDVNDRILRLIISIENKVVVISAVEATPGQTKLYRKGRTKL